ncbi:MAG: metallophosphoesterase [Roseimicrobium sp.]
MTPSRTTRRRFVQGLAATATLGASTTGYGAATEPRLGKRPRITRMEVRMPHLPPGLDGFRIVQISDLHLEPFTTESDIEQTVAVCQALSPDLVAMTGDFVTHEVRPMGVLAEILAPLKAPHGTFACLGNHDWRCGHDRVVKALQERRIKVLRNETRPIHTKGGVLHLAGTDTRYMGEPSLRQTLARWKPGQPLVFLRHEPDVADAVAAAGVPCLQLSGHTHGGQVRLLGLPPLPLRWRRAAWGRRYMSGLYHVGPVQLYVNRGIGCVWLPLRVWCPPEVTEITLRSPLLRKPPAAAA